MTPWPRAKGAILLALPLLPLGGWYVQKGREPGLLTAPVSRKTLVRDVTLAGTIWPRHRHDAWPESSGRVERVFVAPNQRVSEGSPLFAVHCDAQRFELSRKELALSRLDVAAGAAERLTPATDRRLAELEARHDREAVRSCLVASPYAGRVVHVGVEVGDYVGPNQSSQLPPVMLAHLASFPQRHSRCDAGSAAPARRADKPRSRIDGHCSASRGCEIWRCQWLSGLGLRA